MVKNMYKKKIQSLTFIAIIILLVSTIKLSAQDIHFSQYYASPLTLNPANTGDYDGDWRVMNSYRNQWKVISIPYLTNAFAFDKQFYIFSERFSAGFMYLYDQSGSIGFSANKLFLSLAYSKQIAFNNISFGIQGGLVRKAFYTKGITFPSQFTWETGGYDPSLYNNEPDLTDKIVYFDLNLGLKWSKKFNNIKPNAGIAFYHLNFPNESFGDSYENRLPMRTVVHGGAEIKLNNSYYIEPNIIYMYHKKAFNFIPGLNLGVRPGGGKQKVKSVYTGIYYRGGFKQADAMIAVFGVKYQQLNIGLSYDINISNLQVITNKRGAFEISVIYTGISTISKKVIIPCDIY